MSRKWAVSGNMHGYYKGNNLQSNNRLDVLFIDHKYKQSSVEINSKNTTVKKFVLNN